MRRSLNLGLMEDIRAETGSKIVIVMLFLMIGLAIYLSDVEPVVENIYVMPAVTLSILFLVVLTLALTPQGYVVYRWVPFLGLVLLEPVLLSVYHHAGILYLIPLLTLITPLLFDERTGVLQAAIQTVIVIVFTSPLSLASDQAFFAILVLWLILGSSILTLRSISSTLEELNKRYLENKHLLNQAREQQGRLNELVKERTEGNIQLARLNQLANHLRQVAEDERKIKEEFVTRVSHELRTPLNMIIGFCTVLIESNAEKLKRLPHTVVEDLEVILRNSQHLSRLINDILDLSQINAGQMAILKEDAQISEMVVEAVEAVQPLYKSKGLYLHTEIQPDLPLISCDRTRIVEVLLNLLSNAGRYTQEGGVTVRAKARQQAVEIQVVDTGIGIPKQKQDRLFDPFYQVDGGIRRKYGGTGLGLSISKNIIELHNGRMWVESDEGKGTTFTFQLPVEEPVVSSPSVRRWLNPYLPEARAHGRPFDADEKILPRIVTVDPDGDLTRLLQRYMSPGEYVAVETLAAGINEVNLTPARFLVVNTDQISRDMEYLRSTQPLPFSIPAILCSIPTGERIRAQMDIFDALVKPISQKALAETMTKLGAEIKAVLIVDDDPDVRRLMKRMLLLVNPQIEVFTASNGVHAIQAMKRHVVDAILLDLAMPKMDGYEFLEAKKGIPGYAETPVVLISAHLTNEKPIVSDGLGVVVRGGLTIQEFLKCLSSLTSVFGS